MFPKIEHPLFSVTIPSNKKVVKLRPMLVREEKILLMAKESNDSNAVLLAVKQIVSNCLADDKINVDDLTIFDIDYLFIHIRANSIDPTIKIMFDDPEDNNKHHEIMVDLNNVTVKFGDIKNHIDLGNNRAIVLRYPTSKVYESEQIRDAKNAQELVEELLYFCFDSYVDGETVHKFANASREEGLAFIDSLPISAHNKVIEYFSSLPHIFYEVTYKNSKGEEKTLPLNKLDDFFTF